MTGVEDRFDFKGIIYGIRETPSGTLFVAKMARSTRLLGGELSGDVLIAPGANLEQMMYVEGYTTRAPPIEHDGLSISVVHSMDVYDGMGKRELLKGYRNERIPLVDDRIDKLSQQVRELSRQG